MRNNIERIVSITLAIGIWAAGNSMLVARPATGQEVQPYGYSCATQPINTSTGACYAVGSPYGPCQGNCSITTTYSGTCLSQVPGGAAKCSLTVKPNGVQAQDFNGYCGRGQFGCACFFGTAKGAPYNTTGFVCSTSG